MNNPNEIEIGDTESIMDVILFIIGLLFVTPYGWLLLYLAFN